MDRVFLDANVLFSAAYRPDAGLLKLWKLKVKLISSAYSVEEALVNLKQNEQCDRLESLVKDIVVIEGHREVVLPTEVELPEKDRPILMAAINAKATHLLTGGVTHFGKLFGKKVSGVTILLPGDYLRNR